MRAPVCLCQVPRYQNISNWLTKSDLDTSTCFLHKNWQNSQEVPVIFCHLPELEAFGKVDGKASEDSRKVKLQEIICWRRETNSFTPQCAAEWGCWKTSHIYTETVITHYTSLVECVLFHSSTVRPIWSDMLCVFRLENHSSEVGLLRGEFIYERNSLYLVNCHEPMCLMKHCLLYATGMSFPSSP